ncbi:vWA domain-containing protein [Thiolapillus sp.]
MMELLESLEWRAPVWWWLALYPWVFGILRGIWQHKKHNPCAEPELLPWAQARTAPGFGAGRLWRYLLVALAWLLFALALSGPRLVEQDYGEAGSSRGELVLVFDLSLSMTARDVAPSRLERSRQALEYLLKTAHGQKIGLVVYAARPHLLTPVTQDMNLLRHDLGLLRHGLLPSEGSELPDALAFAGQQFREPSAPRGLLLISDGGLAEGDDAGSGRLQTTVQELARRGIPVHVLAAGTPGGTALQAPDGSWLMHDAEPVIASLHEQRLQGLAQQSGGVYAQLGDGEEAWQKLYEEIIGRLSPAGRNDNDRGLVAWKELYSWFLLPAVLLMLLSRVSFSRNAVLQGSIPGLLLISLLGSIVPRPVQADDQAWQQMAHQAYAQKSYLEARKAYARVPGYAGRMGEGSSAYQLKKYTEAAALFTQAVLDASTDRERAQALFNLANTHYRLQDYDAAVAVYQEVLRYDSGLHAAEVNLELARRRQKQQAASEAASGGRQGRGPRSRRIVEGVTITNGRLGLDERPDNRSSIGKNPGMPKPSSAGSLEDDSIFYARPVVSQASEFKDRAWVYAPTTEEGIALEADALEVDESRFWQRLFEQEEGYPAPVETPNELPGVPPW